MTATTPGVPLVKTVLVLRHVAFEDLGVLDPLLRERGYEVRYLDAGVDALDAGAVTGADLVVVLGGPVGVHDADRYPFLGPELEAITARVRADRPTLGICLGAQLVARALGADVTTLPDPEIGYAPVALTAAAGTSPLRHLDGVPVLHWHGDRFDVPAGAVLLASTPACPPQAFTAGTAVLALQFHLETGFRDVERWLIGHAEALAAAGLHPEPIRRDAALVGPALHAAAVRVFTEWLDALDDAARPAP